MQMKLLTIFASFLLSFLNFPAPSSRPATAALRSGATGPVTGIPSAKLGMPCPTPFGATLATCEPRADANT